MVYWLAHLDAQSGEPWFDSQQDLNAHIHNYLFSHYRTQKYIHNKYETQGLFNACTFYI